MIWKPLDGLMKVQAVLCGFSKPRMHVHCSVVSFIRVLFIMTYQATQNGEVVTCENFFIFAIFSIDLGPWMITKHFH